MMFATYGLGLILHAFFAFAVHEKEGASTKCTQETFQRTMAGEAFKILSVQAQIQNNFTSIKGGHLQPALSGLNFCQVLVYLTHQTKGHMSDEHQTQMDKVLVEVWLPMTSDEWNHRLQATGGGGYVTGMFGAHLGSAIKDGWAAVSTDGGHSADLSKVADATWALHGSGEPSNPESMSEREIRWDLLYNFASRSAVDQIIVGKSIVEQYFGEPPQRTYWNGCSTGGRQGYAIAQKHPELVDGILANAPAISFANLVTAEFVPQLIMKETETFLSNCEFEYFRSRVIEECDMLDGVRDGILEDPSLCEFQASSIIGETFSCGEEQFTVTPQMAHVVQTIHEGPKDTLGRNLFPGLDWGVPMTALANITISEHGARSQRPFHISANSIKDLFSRGAINDLSSLGKDSFTLIWTRALSEFGGLLNTDNPDLAKLRDAGTKLLTYHGVNDELIPYQNTLKYRQQVEGVMGGASLVDDYYRVFLAPGVEHCGGGPGPQPKDPLAALVDWVENGVPPETLDAEIIDHNGDLVTKDLCAWPGKVTYMGIGNAKRASSWSCVGGTERDASIMSQDNTQYAAMGSPQQNAQKKLDRNSGRAGQILEGLKGRLEGLGMGLRVEQAK